MAERTLTEVKARCRTILNDEEVISLIKETSTPSAAYTVVFSETLDEAKAKAARWLAIMRRDYPEAFRQIVV